MTRADVDDARARYLRACEKLDDTIADFDAGRCEWWVVMSAHVQRAQARQTLEQVARAAGVRL